MVQGADGSIWIHLHQHEVWLRHMAGSWRAYGGGDRGIATPSCAVVGAVAPGGALWYVTPCEHAPLEGRSKGTTLVRLDPNDETIAEFGVADGLPPVIVDFDIGPDGTVWVAGAGGVTSLTLDTVGGQGQASEGSSPQIAGSMTPPEPVPPLSVPPVDFGDLAGRRYVAEVFSDIEKITGIVYWPSGAGEPLSLDISTPVGDAASRRPVIITGEGDLPEWVRRTPSNLRELQQSWLWPLGSSQSWSIEVSHRRSSTRAPTIKSSTSPRPLRSAPPPTPSV
jgi:hypothetical protein